MNLLKPESSMLAVNRIRAGVAGAVAMLVGGIAVHAAPPATQTVVPDLSPELQQPFRVMAAAEPIDVDIGHAAPFLADIDRDGIKDLLVGQFGEGKLRIYKNIGTNIDPKFDKFTWFKAGAELGKVPAG